MNYVIMFYLMRVLFSYSPIETEPIKLTSYEYTPIKIERVLSAEEYLVQKVLDSIPRRETRFHLIGDKAYTLISPTNDFGKYQLNGINWYRGGVCYGLTYQEFLNNPALQEQKARELMKYNIDYLKSKGKTINRIRLHASWWGLGIAENDYAIINLLYKTQHLHKENVNDLIKELNTNL